MYLHRRANASEARRLRRARLQGDAARSVRQASHLLVLVRGLPEVRTCRGVQVSARNSLEAKAARREARSKRHLNRWAIQGRPIIKHGICTKCSRRRQVVLPAKLCEPCIASATARR